MWDKHKLRKALVHALHIATYRVAGGGLPEAERLLEELDNVHQECL